MAFRYLLEDGSGYYLLEDGVSYYVQETLPQQVPQYQNIVVGDGMSSTERVVAFSG